MRIDSSGQLSIYQGLAVVIIFQFDSIINFNIVNSNGDQKKAEIKAIKTADVSSELIFSSTASHAFDERMRIDSSGRVGIGTSSPSHPLEVRGVNTQINFSSSGTGGGYLMSTNSGQWGISGGVRWNGAGWYARHTSSSIIRDDGDANIRFFTNTSNTVGAYINPAERMRIDSSGNVGIGTTSVFDTASGRGNISLNGASSALIALGVGGSQKLALFHSGTDCELNNQANGFLAFKTNNSERMRIDSSGRLLIGGTSTAENDHANINANGTLTIRRASSGDDCIVIKEGSTNSLLIEASGNVFNYNVGSFAYTSYDNEAGVAGPYAALGSFSGEARISAGSTGSDDVPLVFRTSDGGTLAEKMKLTHDGLLIINNLYNTTSSGAANVFVGSNSQLFRSTSSIKYKENVQDATHGLAKLLELRPVTYTSKQPDNDSTVYGGLIAEEVHEAGLSEFVQYATDGSPDALAYGNMVSLCVKAIQEQQSIIKSLETRIAALES